MAPKKDKKPVAVPPAPPPEDANVLRCPFTGTPIAVEQVSPDGLFMGVGPFWSTRVFPTKEALVVMLRQRAGGKPAESLPRVTVTENEEPEDDPVADLRRMAQEQVIDTDKMFNDA